MDGHAIPATPVAPADGVPPATTTPGADAGDVLEVVLEDAFSGKTPDKARWTMRRGENWGLGAGRSVGIAGGALVIRQDERDAGGAVVSAPIKIRPGCLLRLDKRTRLRPASKYFRAQTAILPAALTDKEPWTEPLARIFYFHYFHKRSLDCFAFNYEGNPAVKPVWDAWFREQLTYDPQTGDTTYSVNGAAPIRTRGRPAAGSIRVGLHAYGWETGHEHAVDEIRVVWLRPETIPSFQRR